MAVGQWRSRAPGGHRDLGDDLGEEPAHHQPAGLLLGNSAGPQIEQLLVVEAPGGTGVPGADDLAGLDLQVGHRVGARAVGEHQVAVAPRRCRCRWPRPGSARRPPTRCGRRASSSPDHLAAHPCTRHWTCSCGWAWSTSSRDSKMLAVVGEVQAQQLGVAARGRRNARRSRSAAPGRRPGSPRRGAAPRRWPSTAWCVLTCTASSAQSAIHTTVSRAASSTTNSTLSA